jgi:hypothetical protein
MLRLRKSFFLPLVVVAVAGCSMLPVPQPPARAQPAPPSDPIVDALKAWQASGIDSYTWQLDVSCECALSGSTEVTVVDGKVTRIRKPGGDVPFASAQAFPLTVDALLQKGIDATTAGRPVAASWPGSNGVPSELSIDRDPNAIDDELSVKVVSFVPAP